MTPTEIEPATFRLAAQCLKQQDNQCTYNVTQRRVRITTVVTKKQCHVYVTIWRQFSCHCYAALSHLIRAVACLHIWMYHIFRYYLINGMIFGRKIY